jgi:sugar transferase EpsL
MGRPALIFKRFLDILIAGAAMILFAPLMAIIAAAIRLRMGGPVLFRDERPGFQGKIFTLLKFRTMAEDRDASGRLLPDSSRITGLGRSLRRTSLDELPQLINVLKGELSIVGPRPLLTKYLELYTAEQMRRHSVKPGITGWAQINGRNNITWDEKFALDLWYVDNWSVMLDLKIIVLTLWKLIIRPEVDKSGDVYVEEFRGSKGPSDAEN